MKNFSKYNIYNHMIIYKKYNNTGKINMFHYDETKIKNPLFLEKRVFNPAEEKLIAVVINQIHFFVNYMEHNNLYYIKDIIHMILCISNKDQLAAVEQFETYCFRYKK